MSKDQTGNTLCKEERLYAQKRIDSLFESGASFIAYPLRIVYSARENETVECKDSYPISIMVSVSKRKFKRAVKRNRVKRLIKEAYRLNKNQILHNEIFNQKSIDIAFLYLKNELPEYEEIEKAMLKTFSILAEKLKIQDESKEAYP